MVSNNDSDALQIDMIHSQAIIDHFSDKIGRRAFVLTPSFPFLFVGTIKDVVDDLVVMDVEITHYAQLENRSWHIHIHNIEVFFIEGDEGPTIPDLSNS